MKLITLDNLNFALGLVANRIHAKWTTLTNQLSGKVDKVEGKQLSTNDFSNEAKQTLEDVEKKSVGIENISINEDGVMTVKNIHGDEANKASVEVHAVAAAKLKTARSINGVPFDGSENIVINSGGTNDIAAEESEIKNLFTSTETASHEEDHSSYGISPYNPPT